MSFKTVRLAYLKRNPSLDTEQKIGFEDKEFEVSIQHEEESWNVLLDIDHPEWHRERSLWPLNLTPGEAIEIAILLLEAARAAQAERDRSGTGILLRDEFVFLLDEFNKQSAAGDVPAAAAARAKIKQLFR